jgi:putative acetyltransferase
VSKMSPDTGRVTEVLVRAYRPEDRDAVINIFVRAIRESAIRDYSPAQTEAWSGVDRIAGWSDVGDRFTWVAVVDELVVGFTDLERSGHLDRMYVHPEHEGRGIASALLTCLEAAARHQGLTRLFTEASITARPFFERRGFKVLTAQVVEYRGEKFTNFRMEKLLAERPPLT